MNENLLEVRTYQGLGYKPLVDFETWRVAYLNYIDELEPENITRVERHIATDEVFVLLAGQAVLFLGGGEGQAANLEAITLQPCQLYNVKQNAWHTVVLSRDATILLVENRDTGPANTEYCSLTAEQREYLQSTAAREIPALAEG
jgi:ureidoglycolate hydrolase